MCRRVRLQIQLEHLDGRVVVAMAHDEQGRGRLVVSHAQGVEVRLELEIDELELSESCIAGRAGILVVEDVQSATFHRFGEEYALGLIVSGTATQKTHDVGDM